MKLVHFWPFWLLQSTASFPEVNGTLPTRAGNNGSALYAPLFEKHSNSTPRFINSTGRTANPLVKVLQAKNLDLQKRSLLDLGHGHGGPRHGHSAYHLNRRVNWELPEGTCAPGTPCANGACCSNRGICGYDPASCGVGNCISNCDAKAPCGQYAKLGEENCPLNVCCSFYGFCGATDDFCTTGGEHPCQEGYGTCGDAPRPTCAGDSTSQRVIGYYEGWATKRACDKRDPEDIDLTAFTHLNFAFAFFDPKSFQMTAMRSGDNDLYRRFTALKTKKPSLKTWIAVGGWSFNDGTNIPNTRTAFSEMVSTSPNRRTFIDSLTQLLKTYNFDGVDLDWEYPVAEDRGGVKADKENFVTFLRELRAALPSSRYGISITLPASYWYLQGFDVKALQINVDWMNVMSYDIHGVWDRKNEHTGPYILPHSNLTEIELGLDLLWRAGVDPGKVVLGLGWYGRSFTLTNTACTLPNGICTFEEGGKPGECTKSAGTLTNAEINRIITKRGLLPSFDHTAAVKWVTWEDQWVSYDDGETIQLKIQHANSRCLAGRMVWAVDQDDLQNTSTNDLIGIGPANGVPVDVAQRIKDSLNNATQTAAIADSCYWTFCGGSCKAGWFPATAASGQIAGIQRDSDCEEGYQTLCCAPGTTLGKCNWNGWRGVGLSCAPICTDESAVVIARNSNAEGRDCNGGYQAFCCTGFVPSSLANTAELALIGKGGLVKRGLGLGLLAGGGACVGSAAVVESILVPFVKGFAFPLGEALLTTCLVVGSLFGYVASLLSKMWQVYPYTLPAPEPKGNVGKPHSIGKMYGQWPLMDFRVSTTGPTTSCDCVVTYTCRYGMGWDEICDNQRWAIDKGLHGNTIYHYQERRAPIGPATTRPFGARLYHQEMYDVERAQHFIKLARQKTTTPSRWRCEVDEFPMGALAEAQWPNPQYVRLVNGAANGGQGNDYKNWKYAVWRPCKEYRSRVCGSKFNDAPPPITWAFDSMPPRLARTDGSHFIQAYGFDSQTVGAECWPTFSVALPKASGFGGGIVITTTVSDHGFRVLPDDPLYTDYNWPVQNYKTDPLGKYPNIPEDVDSVKWLKRREVATLLGKAWAPMHHHDGDTYCDGDEILVEHDKALWCVTKDYLGGLHGAAHHTAGLPVLSEATPTAPTEPIAATTGAAGTSGGPVQTTVPGMHE